MKRLDLLTSAGALAALAACSGGSSTIPAAPVVQAAAQPKPFTVNGMQGTAVQTDSNTLRATMMDNSSTVTTINSDTSLTNTYTDAHGKTETYTLTLNADKSLTITGRGVAQTISVDRQKELAAQLPSNERSAQDFCDQCGSGLVASFFSSAAYYSGLASLTLAFVPGAQGASIGFAIAGAAFAVGAYVANGRKF